MTDTCKDCGTPIVTGQKIKLCVKCGITRMLKVSDSIGKKPKKGKKK